MGAWDASIDAGTTPILPTVRDVLLTDELQRGGPTVVAGMAGLDRPVRWVHVSELADIAHLLEGGELILTTGIALPTERRELQRYAEELRRVGAAGVVIELGRRYQELPRALREAAEQRDLPLITLQHEIRFIRVTEAVHAAIVDGHLATLRRAQEIHDTFTSLAVEGASAELILGEAARLANRCVVLENLAHRVVAVSVPSGSVEAMLEGWDQVSRNIGSTDRTDAVTVGSREWLTCAVGARGERWGRLLMELTGAQGAERQLVTATAERAVTAVVLNRLVEHDRAPLERQAEQTLLHQLRDGTAPTSRGLTARIEALGLPLRGCTLVGGVVRLRAGTREERAAPATLGSATSSIAGAIRSAGLHALVAPLDSADIGFVISSPIAVGTVLRDALERCAEMMHDALARETGETAAIVAVGDTVGDIGQLRYSLAEAEQVATAAEGVNDRGGFFRVHDVRLEGLVYLLRDDPRIQTFVERELGPVLVDPDEGHPSLLEALDAFLTHGGNKSAAADQLGISRPTLYQRLQRIEKVLSVDLDSIATRISLHVALLAHRSQRAI